MCKILYLNTYYLVLNAKFNENPSIGVLLCREKDEEIVEYALSRSVSPTIISDYETKLIPKNILREKLNELYKLLDKDVSLQSLFDHGILTAKDIINMLLEYYPQLNVLQAYWLISENPDNVEESLEKAISLYTKNRTTSVNVGGYVSFREGDNTIYGTVLRENKNDV